MPLCSANYLGSRTTSFSTQQNTSTGQVTDNKLPHHEQWIAELLQKLCAARPLKLMGVS